MISGGSMSSRGKTYFIYWIGLPVLLLILQSCGPDIVTDESRHIPVEGWKVQDTIGFEFGILDSTQIYDLYISLRHTTDYAYRNLFLFVDTYFPAGKHTRDTLEFVLAGQDGSWIGKGFSKIKYNRFLIRKGMTFPETGTYRFVFQHAMRVEDLPGLRNLGVRITESDRPMRPTDTK